MKKKTKQDLFTSSKLFVLSKLEYVYNGRYYCYGNVVEGFAAVVTSAVSMSMSIYSCRMQVVTMHFSFLIS